MFVEAAVALGHKLIDDFNGERMTGVGFNHATIRDVRPMNAWQSYVAPALDNPALTVPAGARMHRVLLEDGRAVGVEYAANGALQAFAAEIGAPLPARAQEGAGSLPLNGLRVTVDSLYTSVSQVGTVSSGGQPVASTRTS
ncbi:GMC family oxidoreductase N-terminal domain-containing protein [Streptomyces sp. AC550_RSS872]|uniref:GMC family oxidoreductase N-terminal domain-containing protein n=1 Tax=Streptomyces sp. AC550_RSS872 TaxID=2823689 RepID=UPI0027E52E00|nr:GMC family oxidoreductase N-terminal domain-containing protein [Streptomyces sp. AC550_RSS872]